MLNFFICSSGDMKLAARSQPPYDKLFDTFDKELLDNGSFKFIAMSFCPSWPMRLRKSPSSAKFVTFYSRL